ncbi:hypothetical protein [Companilactobacillus furfuricola]|uniref:hypothetical protein n=1 Tax=Companilactobacillus furfuricola TaxID=1462575 RepID=UPI000F7A9CDD|nr:hypothetical protein [Companilactobacillus furfuricola]
MKLKKILLSSSLALGALLAGIGLADGTAQADAVDDSNTHAHIENVSADTNVEDLNSDTTEVSGVSGDASASTQNQAEVDAVSTADTNEAGIVATSTSTNNESNSSTNTTINKPVDTSTEANSGIKDKVVSSVKSTAKNAAADFVGNDVVAPLAEGALAKVKPLSNVYAGATGFVKPTSNVVGKASHDLQDAAIGVVGALPGGKIPSLLMKLAQPLDLVDNTLGGVYGLATGQNDLIPNAIGNKVSSAIKGTETTTKTTAKTDFSDGYKNSRINGTVTANVQAPLFNVMEQPVSRSLGKGTSWFTDILKENTKSGAQYYRVSTNEYVRAQDVQFS